MYKEQRYKKDATPHNASGNTEKVIGKQLPYNSDAERAILSAILLHDDYLSQTTDIIAAEDFYLPAHQKIMATMMTMTQEHKRVDLISLQDELQKKNLLEEIGGLVYLVSLQEDIPAVGLIKQHAKIVKEKSILRSLITSAAGIIGSCYQQDNIDIETVLDGAEKTIFDISNQRIKNDFVQLDIWLKKTFQHLSDIKAHSQGITGIPTGYKKIDQMTSGFQPGDFIVLAARPSMGKTALALCMAEYAARTSGSVGIFSLEMSAEQLTLRLLSAESGISHHNIRNATISSQDWVTLTSVVARLADMKLFIDDTALLTVMDLRAKARKLKKEHDVQFLVIDYLQLLHTNTPHENRHQEVSLISRSLKALAKELHIPILALSQLSRAVDSRMDKRPILSDLRESGAIEQDADLIMFLYRDVVYNAETENPALSELIIGKQRNGPTGTVFLNFVRELTKFEDTQQGY